MISSPPHDGISAMAIFQAIQLVHEWALGLLPTMVCCIQHEVCMLKEAFRKGTATRKAWKEFSLPTMGLALGWKYRMLTLWRGSCYISRSSFSTKKNHQKASVLRIFAASKTRIGKGIKWQEFEGWLIAMKLTVFSVLSTHSRRRISWRVLRPRRWPLHT